MDGIREQYYPRDHTKKRRLSDCQWAEPSSGLKHPANSWGDTSTPHTNNSVDRHPNKQVNQSRSPNVDRNSYRQALPSGSPGIDRNPREQVDPEILFKNERYPYRQVHPGRSPNIDRNLREQGDPERSLYNDRNPYRQVHPGSSPSIDRNSREQVDSEKLFNNDRHPYRQVHSGRSPSIERSPRDQVNSERSLNNDRYPYRQVYPGGSFSIDRNPREQSYPERSLNNDRHPYRQVHPGRSPSIERSPHDQVNSERSLNNDRYPYRQVQPGRSPSIDRNPREQVDPERSFNNDGNPYRQVHPGRSSSIDRNPREQVDLERSLNNDRNPSRQVTLQGTTGANPGGSKVQGEGNQLTRLVERAHLGPNGAREVGTQPSLQQGSGAAAKRRARRLRKQHAAVGGTITDTPAKRIREVSDERVELQMDVEKAKIQGSYCDAAAGFRMAIIPETYPETRFEAEDSPALQELLFSGMLAAPDPLPLINMGNMAAGALHVICANEASVDWLKGLTGSSVSNHTIKVVTANDLSLPVKMAWKSRYTAATNIHLVLQLLQRLNPGLKTEEWRVVNTLVESTYVRRIILMDRVSAEVIKASNYTLQTGIDYSLFKLLEESTPKGEQEANADKVKDIETSSEDAVMLPAEAIRDGSKTTALRTSRDQERPTGPTALTSSTGAKELCWWNKELEMLRRKTRAIFNKAKAQGDFREYTKMLTEYHKAVRKYKRKSCRASTR